MEETTSSFEDLFGEIEAEREDRRENGWTHDELEDAIDASDYFEASDITDLSLSNTPNERKVSLAHNPTGLMVTDTSLRDAVTILGKAISLTKNPETHRLPTGTTECPVCGGDCPIQHHDYGGLSVYCDSCDVKSTASTSRLVSKPMDEAIETLPDVSWTYDCPDCGKEHRHIEPFDGEFFTKEDFDHEIQNGAYAESPGTVNCPCGHVWEFRSFDWSNTGENECPDCGRTYSFTVSEPTPEE